MAYNITHNKNITNYEDSCMENPLYKSSLITLFIITIFLSIILNILVWIIFAINKALHTHGNYFIISLSVSDFITSASLGWIEIYYIWDYPNWVFGKKGTFAQNAFWCLSLVTPFMHIIFISADRFFAVMKPANYHRQKSIKKVALKLCLIWVYSILATSVMTMHFIPTIGDYYEWNVLAQWYYPFIGLHIITPLFVCSFLYYFILKKILISKRRLEHDSKPILWREYSYTKTIALLVLMLYLVWLPVIVMEIIYAVLAYTCVVAQLGTVSVWLTCTSGVINPAILLTRNPNFRKTLISTICKLRCYGGTANNSSVMALKIKIETSGPSKSSRTENSTT